MKVLLATDGSSQASIALRTAASLLRTEGMEFDVVCVAPEFHFPKSKTPKNPQKAARMVDAYRQKIRLEAQGHLLHAQAMLGTRGIKAKTRVESGSPGRVITQLAAEYDLVVVGAHNQYTRSKPGLGAVASRVVSTAQGAVLIGRQLSEESRQWRILAAIDGSLAAEAALEFLATSFQVDEAEITLMHIVETPWVNLGLDREWFEYQLRVTDPDGSPADEGLEEELQYEGEAIVASAQRKLERFGHSVNTVITEGDPALEILSESERGEYDLIVIGATGESDLKHQLLGGVSAKVAQAALCSTLVVKFKE